jgi:hypothetical protein
MIDPEEANQPELGYYESESNYSIIDSSANASDGLKCSKDSVEKSPERQSSPYTRSSFSPRTESFPFSPPGNRARKRTQVPPRSISKGLLLSNK